MDAWLVEGPRWNKTAPPHGEQRKHLQEHSMGLLCFGPLQVDESLEVTEFVKAEILCGTHAWDSCP